jgi:flagellar hook protein FlgE
LDTNLPVGDIVVPVGTLRQPIASTAFHADMNLNAAAATGTEFSTSIETFDSLGVSHIISAKFTKSATANEWDYELSVPDSDVTSPVSPLTGTITFDEHGIMASPSSTDTPPRLTVAGLKSGAADMALDWELFSGETGRVTQFAQPSAVSANDQNGEPAAQLVRVGLADGGQILAQFSNGDQLVVGQLAMASIRNPESLVAVGDNNYQLSSRSALPAIGVPGTGGRGQILGGSTEASTVDIAKEFTNLIVYQRGYQANTRVITTVDEISQETINLKR